MRFYFLIIEYVETKLKIHKHPPLLKDLDHKDQYDCAGYNRMTYIILCRIGIRIIQLINC